IILDEGRTFQNLRGCFENRRLLWFRNHIFVLSFPIIPLKQDHLLQYIFFALSYLLERTTYSISKQYIGNFTHKSYVFYQLPKKPFHQCNGKKSQIHV